MGTDVGTLEQGQMCGKRERISKIWETLRLERNRWRKLKVKKRTLLAY